MQMLTINPDLETQLEAEEKELIAAELMRPALDKKNDDFLDLPAPEVSLEAIRAIIRAERDED